MLLALLLAGCGGDQPAASQGDTANTDAIALATALAETAGEEQGDQENMDDVLSALATATVLVGEQGGEGAALPPGAIDLSKIDPCSLLTQDEVEAIMGPVDYKQIRGTGIVGEIHCTFVTGGYELPHLQVSVWPPDPYSWEFETGQLVVDGTPSSVAGIGDEAVTADVKAWQKLFVLLKGKAFISVRINPKDVEDAKQIAAKVIERLP
jgi:hypothetical protein